MAFKAIRLDSGGGLSATVIPEAGMITVSLAFEGEEFLGQRHGLAGYVESSSTMGIPILYPWANRLARDSWKFGSRPARIDPDASHIKRDLNGLAIHGTLAASPLWEVNEAKAGDDLGSATVKATLEFGDHPELLQTFPFPHRLELEFRLAGPKLSVRTTVTPTGEYAVPLAYGFHPYLTLPGSRRPEWTVRLPAMFALETDSRQIPTGIGKATDAHEGPLEDRDYDDACSGLEDGARFSVADERHQVTVSFERGYRAAQIYSPAGENFICFEPMKAPTNALVSGRDLASVEPGDSDISEFSIAIGKPEPPSTTSQVHSVGKGVEHGGSVNQPSTAPDRGPAPGSAEAGRSVSTRFRIDREDPAESVRRVARSRVESAVASLRQGAESDRATAVHTARKDMKKMRSVLRLVRGELGKKTYREENRRFRDAARLLSTTRDTEVLAGTLDAVLRDYPSDGPSVEGLAKDLERRRQRASSERGSSIEASLGEAADRIEGGGRMIASWPLTESGWKMFEPGLKRSYSAGCRDLERVDKCFRRDRRPESELMHDFRKRVKDLWYETRLLREAWPAGLEGPEAEAGLLADLLGEYNDLSVLAEEIETRRSAPGEGEGHDQDDFSVLVETIDDRQSVLLGECIPIARRLFAEEPGAFTARIGAYWSA
jgi:galactose mutarotase-like enzyme/CHAD domain-containing protein